MDTTLAGQDYDGHHFASRLEARWARAFNELEIEYEYQPEQVLVRDRLLTTEGADNPKRLHSPTFWLPQFSLWGEVRRSFTKESLREFLGTAAWLSSNGGGGCHDSGGNDVVLFGPIPPAISEQALPVLLHFHKGDLHGYAWDFEHFSHGGFDYRQVANDADEVFTNPGILNGYAAGDRDPRVTAALDAARTETFTTETGRS